MEALGGHVLIEVTDDCFGLVLPWAYTAFNHGVNITFKHGVARAARVIGNEHKAPLGDFGQDVLV